MTAEDVAPEDKGRRITVELDASAIAELDRLKETTGRTTSELFRHAFNLLRMYVRARREGGDLCTVKQGNADRAIDLPFVVDEAKGV